MSTSVVARNPVEKKPFYRKSTFPKPKKVSRTPKKNFSKPPFHTDKKTAGEKEELAQVEQEVNAQILLDEEILLTPENFRPSTPLFPVSESPNRITQTKPVPKRNLEIQTSNDPKHPSGGSLSQPVEDQIRNNLLTMLNRSPSSEVSSENQRKQIEHQILSLLNMSPNKEPAKPNGDSPNSPKNQRDNSPTNSATRWAGLSTSPAPSKLPIPLFVGPTSKSEPLEIPERDSSEFKRRSLEVIPSHLEKTPTKPRKNKPRKEKVPKDSPPKTYKAKSKSPRGSPRNALRVGEGGKAQSF